MININLKIEKKDLYLLVAVMVFLVGITYVIAYGSGQPAVHGHDASEIEVFGDWQTDDSGQIGGVGDDLRSGRTRVYQAATDGIVCSYAATAGGIIGYTDENDPPITIRNVNSNLGIASPAGLCFPVKKNNFWKITGAQTVYWISIGS